MGGDPKNITRDSDVQATPGGHPDRSTIEHGRSVEAGAQQRWA